MALVECNDWTASRGTDGWKHILEFVSLAHRLSRIKSAVANLIPSVHDGDIAPFLTALGIFTGDKELLPTTHIAANREWRISPILPMGARVTLERLSCSPNHEDPYVRININDRITPLPFCRSGPGESCPLNQFVEHVSERRQEVGDFAERCELTGDAGHISFLHQD